ncbi:DUF6002 family protein [Amycolatopsis anabasis]|uniref:DUF6002 family protein n=1 Tax=Amycolatopsis anabasis TaxID=1840409 RepID=UPI00131E73F5|nr:DUF6002 family protein [Amycolatopsis anabasis]
MSAVASGAGVVTSREVCVPGVLAHYYPELTVLLRGVGERVSTRLFQPGWSLPELDDRLVEFFAPSTMSWTELGIHGETELSLLDLRGNPGTRTTKTFASLLMVARAVAHIQATGDRIAIVTPSSANKATALRDAVLRAIETGLVSPEQLQIVSLVPAQSQPKLWDSALRSREYLARHNPILVHRGGERAGVKTIVGEFAASEADQVTRSTGVKLWFTLALDNYRVADAVRAFVEQDFLPAVPVRLHAHAVSSAFGLLGHAFGEEWRGRPGRAQYFLVQHLDTPDMVLDLYCDTFDRSRRPDYEFDPGSGLYRQDRDPHFPQWTHAVDEALDPTFYTRAPATSPTMKQLIRGAGGGGIVVSLYECLQRYARIRALLSRSAVTLPSDPRELREWSLVMAMTGVLNAIDRQVIPVGANVVVHASGSYGIQDYTPIPAADLIEVRDSGELATQVTRAVTA